MQQYLIPHRTGDERLLIPGWAGELTDPELAFSAKWQSLLKRGGFFCFSDTPHREATGGGVLVTVGVWLLCPMAVLTLFFAVMSTD